MKKLLERNPVMRMTVGEALAHPFIKCSEESENIVSDDDDGHNLASFMKKLVFLLLLLKGM